MRTCEVQLSHCSTTSGNRGVPLELVGPLERPSMIQELVGKEFWLEANLGSWQAIPLKSRHLLNSEAKDFYGNGHKTSYVMLILILIKFLISIVNGIKLDIVGARLGWKMLWKGGAGQLGRFVFLFTLIWAQSFSPTSEFTGSSIEAKCKPVKKYKGAREKHTSELVKSPYGVGRYCDMAVSPTRSHLLWFQHFEYDMNLTLNVNYFETLCILIYFETLCILIYKIYQAIFMKTIALLLICLFISCFFKSSWFIFLLK